MEKQRYSGVICYLLIEMLMHYYLYIFFFINLIMIVSEFDLMAIVLCLINT